VQFGQLELVELSKPYNKEELMKTVLVFVIVFVAFFTCQNTLWAADAWPTKPINLVVGYAPGGGTDMVARMAVEIINAKKLLPQPIVVQNKAGGSGRVAAAVVAKEKPDGYTILATTDGAFILGPFFDKVSYKPIEDFTFIAQNGKLDFGLIVPANSPFKTFKDLLDFARANPDKLNIGLSGADTADHVCLQALFKLEKVKVKFVPFAGVAPSMQAFLGGHVMATSGATDFAGYAAQAREGKGMRVLITMGDRRKPEFPNVPTLKELGYPLTYQSWYVISGPKGMDNAITEKLRDAFKTATQDPAYIKLLKEMDLYDDTLEFYPGLKNLLAQRADANEQLFKKLEMGLAFEKK
jgi:tripartite-type tricarboxylate transporter receptor subunit TctC